MTNPTLSRTKLKLELAQARKLHIAEEREEARRKEAERTAELRALRLAKDREDDTNAAKPRAKKKAARLPGAGNSNTVPRRG